MKIKLWTIQTEKGWHELKKKGHYTDLGEFIQEEFLYGYHWMITQMNARIGPPQFKDQFPIWAWFQYEGINKRKPDLRRSAHLVPGTKGFRIELLKEENEVLLSDFDLWHVPLSYHCYLADSEDHNKKFDNKKTKAGLAKTNHQNLPDDFKDFVEKSWEKIFDLTYEAPYFASPFNEKSIQATFWQIKESEIIKVEKFIAR